MVRTCVAPGAISVNSAGSTVRSNPTGLSIATFHVAGADSVLFQNGVFDIPDILANAGGVTVSYFEWVQDQYGFFWSDKEVNRYLEKIMIKAFCEVREKARKYKTHMRTGAYCLAVDRVAKATSVRGIFP